MKSIFKNIRKGAPLILRSIGISLILAPIIIISAEYIKANSSENLRYGVLGAFLVLGLILLAYLSGSLED